MDIFEQARQASSEARMRTCTHEAGHAVAARILTGGGADPVRIVIEGPHEGWSAGATVGNTRDLLVVDLAGGSALEAFGDPEPWRGASNDLAQAMRVADMIDAARVDELLQEAAQRAAWIVRTYDSAILHLARVLHERLWLEGEEVTEALDVGLARVTGDVTYAGPIRALSDAEWDRAWTMAASRLNRLNVWRKAIASWG